MTGSCVTIGEGTCLRCANGMSADSTGICTRRARFGMTHSMRRELRHVCGGGDFLHGV